MKKLLFLLSFIVATATIYSQTEKGKIVLSGATGLQFASSQLKYVYSGVTDEKVTTTTISFLPAVAYFAADNLAIGLTCSITSSSVKIEGESSKSVTTSINLLPTALYFFKVDGKIKPLVQVGAGLASMIDKYSSSKTKATGLAISFGGGIACFVKDNLSLDIGLSYTFATLKNADNTNEKLKEGNFGASAGFSLYF